MLEESLRRLQTDHLDVWQIHGIVYDNDPELAYARGGVLEAFDLNPDGVRNQIEGNVVQTVSRTPKEQVTFYGARPVTPDLEFAAEVRLGERPRALLPGVAGEQASTIVTRFQRPGAMSSVRDLRLSLGLVPRIVGRGPIR